MIERCPKCNSGWKRRQRIGPYSRKKTFMILGDVCGKCGHLTPLHPERLSYQEKEWVRRSNERKAEYELNQENKR